MKFMKTGKISNKIITEFCKSSPHNMKGYLGNNQIHVRRTDGRERFLYLLVYLFVDLMIEDISRVLHYCLFLDLANSVLLSPT